MKKRLMSGILVVLLLCALCLSACGGDVPEETVEQTPEKALLADQWEAYLAAAEDVYAKLYWAMDYADAFFTEDSWESLLKARAACVAAETHLRSLSAPAFTLTEEQCSALTEAGVEVDAVRSEFLALPEWILQEADTLTALCAMLEQDVFIEAEFSGMDEWLVHNRGVRMDTAEYLCAMTNYILLQTEQQARWETLPDRYPNIFLAKGEWSDDSNELMSRGAAALDRFEERLTGMAEYGGLQEYALKIIQEAMDTGDLTYLEQQMHIVTGLPAYFPDPGWLGGDEQRYYLMTDEQSGEKLPVEAGSELTKVPSGCYISCSGIAREEVEAYGRLLEEWGFRSVSKWQDDGSFVVYAVYNSSSVMVEWTEKGTIVYLAEPVGCLIPNLYLMALVIE